MCFKTNKKLIKIAQKVKNILKIQKERLKKREKYIEIAKEYVKNLSKTISIKKAFIIGSVARGDFNESSDVDVLIIAESLPQHPLKRLYFLYKTVIPPVEPKAYTPEEYKKLLKDGNPLAKEAEIIGIKIFP